MSKRGRADLDCARVLSALPELDTGDLVDIMAAASALLQKRQKANKALGRGSWVHFGGQVLRWMTESELLAACPGSYDSGFVCDGCEVEFCRQATGSQPSWQEDAQGVVFHGEGAPLPYDSNASGGGGALDLCLACAADPNAADARYRSATRPQPRPKPRPQRPRGPAAKGAARMLYEHSGRRGFDALEADAAVRTPSKETTCAMLRREAELRNAPATQSLLDELEAQELELEAEERMPETLDEANAMIASLQAELQAAREQKRGEREQSHGSCDGDGDGPVLSEAVLQASCDREVFERIKAQVVEEFGLGPEYVDVLNSAVSRFPGDADIVESANYIKYNRAEQGDLATGDTVPIDTLMLASLGGGGALAPLRSHLQPARGGRDRRPCCLVAGSIT